ncbi:MAG: antitermination protein NusG [Bacteroidetes bacterium HGW-Bacteroidetes-22]|nr:MAG: antitermination protein NusG [Bacteroidetes bacterium HGW-Bacteroidetes-22]
MMSNLWHVLYTAPRAEKRVNIQLLELGVETYLPLYQATRQWVDRKKLVEVPLFSSYIFVRHTARDYFRIVQTQGVVRFVYYCGRPAVIREEEINRIREFLVRTDGYRTWLEPEMSVEIIRGPFCGAIGQIERVGRNKLRLRINALGTVVYAELERESVRVLEMA